MNSLPSIEQVNQERFLENVRRLNPELYLIYLSLQETGVNPMILPKIIRQLANLSTGTGFGKVQIFMSKRIITQIKGEESDEVNEEAVLS